MKSFSHLSTAAVLVAAVLLPAAGTCAQDRTSYEDRLVARSDGSYVYRARRGYDPLVAQVQSILVQKDIYHHRHHNQVDGIFGEETRHAVEDFQRLGGLPATGMLDSATLQALGLIGGDGEESEVARRTPSAAAAAPTPARAPAADEVLTPEDVAFILKVTEADVIELIRTNKLPAKKIGANWRVLRSAVDTFFRSVDPVEEEEAEDNSAMPQQRQSEAEAGKHDHDHDHDHDDAVSGKKPDHKH
jgi:excisionase family DNA binding protein